MLRFVRAAELANYLRVCVPLSHVSLPRVVSLVWVSLALQQLGSAEIATASSVAKKR